jgi:hypothetical protein
MSWWNSSWLFALPSIDFSLPAGIQRHFLSFLLKRFLGRFVKPGQLDIQNIDSQIGSGYVQVKDVHLDPTVRFSAQRSELDQYLNSFAANQRSSCRAPNPASPGISGLRDCTDTVAQSTNFIPRTFGQLPPPHLSPGIIVSAVTRSRFKPCGISGICRRVFHS